MNTKRKSETINEYVRRYGPKDAEFDLKTIDRPWVELTLEQRYARAFAAASFGGKVIGRMVASGDMGEPEITALLGQDDGWEDEEEDDDE